MPELLEGAEKLATLLINLSLSKRFIFLGRESLQRQLESKSEQL